MVSTTDPEAAVRQYLLYLDDPSSVRDEAKVAEARTAVEEARDPIARLKAIAALERAQAVDGEVLRGAFVEHAKSWAEAEGIPARAFLEVGVPAADLVAAGLTVPARRSARAARSGDAPRGRAPRLSLDEVAAKLPSVEFRLADLAAAIGREAATTRNYLVKLVEHGVVVVVGDDPSHNGKGKAPKLYTKA